MACKKGSSDLKISARSLGKTFVMVWVGMDGVQGRRRRGRRRGRRKKIEAMRGRRQNFVL
jgi:hypothetical protein